MESDKAVHFGRFVAWKRLALGLSREEFGQRAGVSARHMATIEGNAEPDVFDTTFGGIARALRMDPRELDQAWRDEAVPVTFPRKPKGKRKTADESAVARLLAGELVMLNELKAAAEKKGVGLGELFREISRLWLDEHRPPKVAHTQLDGLKPRTPPAPRSAGEGSSRDESVPGPRPARRAGRNGR